MDTVQGWKWNEKEAESSASGVFSDICSIGTHLPDGGRGGRQLIESGFWRGCIQHQRENVEKEAERMGDFQWKEVLLQLQRGETQRHHSENSGKVLLF